jgi:hypothetical protein
MFGSLKILTIVECYFGINLGTNLKNRLILLAALSFEKGGDLEI